MHFFTIIFCFLARLAELKVFAEHLKGRVLGKLAGVSCFQSGFENNPSLQGVWMRPQIIPEQKLYCETAKGASRACLRGAQKKFGKPKHFEVEI